MEETKDQNLNKEKSLHLQVQSIGYSFGNLQL